MRTAVRLAAAALLALLPLAVLVEPAAAHNVLRSTAPTADQRLAAAPQAIVLTFDEPAIATGTQLLVTGPAGEVQDGGPQLVDATVRQALRPDLTAGRYEVEWRVTSADGHPINGRFGFTVGTAAGGTTAPVEPSAGSAAPAPASGAGSRDTALIVWLCVLGVVVIGAVVWLVSRSRGSSRPG